MLFVRVVFFSLRRLVAIRIHRRRFGVRSICGSAFLPVGGLSHLPTCQGKHESKPASTKPAAEQLAAANESLQKAEDEVRRSEPSCSVGTTYGPGWRMSSVIRSEQFAHRPRCCSRMSRTTKPLIGELAGFISTEVDRTKLAHHTAFLDFARPMHLKIREDGPRRVARQSDCGIRENTIRQST